MSAYYNEHDPHAAAWLRELIKAGHIADGIVDERSIEDARPDELAGFTQCHFFAGIGVWSYALRQAGWPDDKPVWTGSCPCQPFSAAGAGNGFDDERHLWPAFHHLIEQCRPVTVFGEQVASKATNAWFDLVQADLEGVGYAFGLVPFTSAGVGAPHIRERAYWVADTSINRFQGCTIEAIRSARRWQEGDATGRGGFRSPGWMGNTESERCGEARKSGTGCSERSSHAGSDDRLDDPKSQRWGICDTENIGQTYAQVNPLANTSHCESDEPCGEQLGESATSPTNGFWRDADWLLCRDGRWRPVRPGSFPLVDGASEGVGHLRDLGAQVDAGTKEARTMRLRGYGNAINAEAARVFIESFMDMAN